MGSAFAESRCQAGSPSWTRAAASNERTVSICGTAWGKPRQAVIGWEGLHHKAQVRHLEDARPLNRRLRLRDRDAALRPGERRLARCQADPALGSAATGYARGSAPGHVIEDHQSPSRFPAQVAYKEAEWPLNSWEQWPGRPFQELDHDGRKPLNGEGRARLVLDHAGTGLSLPISSPQRTRG